MRDWMIATAWISAMVVAPHGLTVIGNLAGNARWAAVVLVAAALILYWWSSALLVRYRMGQRRLPAGVPYAPHGVSAALSAMVLDSGRLITAITAATILLVTAGFAFNETLVYWFPNFGFAFLLLGVVTIAQVAGPRIAQQLQLVSAAVAVGGWILLIAVGLWKAPQADLPPQLTHTGLTVHAGLSAMLLFTGFDVALHQRGALTPKHHRPVQYALALLATLIVLWCVVSFWHVSATRLADTTIPHIIAARNIAGQWGRVCMAIVAIAASLAAVNALFGMIATRFAQTNDNPAAHPDGIAWWRRPPFWAVLCSLLTATAMATGMAGTDVIDVVLRAGLYLWIAGYGAVFLQMATAPPRPPDRQWTTIKSHGMAVFMLAAAVLLILFDPDRRALITTIAYAWPIAAALVFLMRRFKRD